MQMNIVINTDNNYIQHTMAMLCSLYENNSGHDITVHVLQKELSEKSRNYISGLSERYGNKAVFYTIDEEPLRGVQFRKNRPLSMAAYYRLMLSSVLPREIDKVLYLDCDVIVLRDLSEIFNIELDNYALAASLDQFPCDQQHRLQLHMEVDERTFCSGIMLVNLKYWREHDVEPGLLEYAKRYRKVVYLHDQDVLNYYFKKHWFLLPPKWNRVAYSLRPIAYASYKRFDIIDYLNRPMLYHYASANVKPWYGIPSPEREVYLKYLKKSDYKEIKFIQQSCAKYLRMLLKTQQYKIKKRIMLFFINKKTK